MELRGILDTDRNRLTAALAAQADSNAELQRLRTELATKADGSLAAVKQLETQVGDAKAALVKEQVRCKELEVVVTRRDAEIVSVRALSLRITLLLRL